MCALNDNVYIIGGSFSNEVEKFSFKDFETQKMPKMCFDRKDSSCCIVDAQFLFVFMGYSSKTEGICSSLEKLDVTDFCGSQFFEMISMYDPYETGMFRIKCGIIHAKAQNSVTGRYEDKFLLLGGWKPRTGVTDCIAMFDLKTLNIQLTKNKLASPTCFTEKMLLSTNLKNYFNFTEGSLKFISYDIETGTSAEEEACLP